MHIKKQNKKSFLVNTIICSIFCVSCSHNKNLKVVKWPKVKRHIRQILIKNENVSESQTKKCKLKPFDVTNILDDVKNEFTLNESIIDLSKGWRNSEIMMSILRSSSYSKNIKENNCTNSTLSYFDSLSKKIKNSLERTNKYHNDCNNIIRSIVVGYVKNIEDSYNLIIPFPIRDIILTYNNYFIGNQDEKLLNIIKSYYNFQIEKPNNISNFRLFSENNLVQFPIKKSISKKENYTALPNIIICYPKLKRTLFEELIINRDNDLVFLFIESYINCKELKKEENIETAKTLVEHILQGCNTEILKYLLENNHIECSINYLIALANSIIFKRVKNLREVTDFKNRPDRHDILNMDQYVSITKFVTEKTFLHYNNLYLKDLFLLFNNLSVYDSTLRAIKFLDPEKSSNNNPKLLKILKEVKKYLVEYHKKFFSTNK